MEPFKHSKWPRTRTIGINATGGISPKEMLGSSSILTIGKITEEEEESDREVITVFIFSTLGPEFAPYLIERAPNSGRLKTGTEIIN